jgi:hypothetical protein
MNTTEIYVCQEIDFFEFVHNNYQSLFCPKYLNIIKTNVPDNDVNE